MRGVGGLDNRAFDVVALLEQEQVSGMVLVEGEKRKSTCKGGPNRWGRTGVSFSLTFNQAA